MMKFESISLELGGNPVLRNVSLDLQPGSVTVVLGPNGTGKSSLLKVASGEWSATHGDVRLYDQPVKEWRAEERAKIMGVLPQESTLNFPYLVQEVVMLGRTPHATGLARDTEIVDQALHQVDCQHLRQRLYTVLSGGEKQRIQFARVLAQIWEPQGDKAPVMLLDEPSASFDIEHQLALISIVRALAEKGYLIVMVLHDLNLAASCADQMVLLRCGEIAAQGAPDQVVTQANIKHIFNVEADVVSLPGRRTPVVVPR